MDQSAKIPYKPLNEPTDLSNMSNDHPPSYLPPSYQPPSHHPNPSTTFNHNPSPVVIMQQPSAPQSAAISSSVRVNVGRSEGVCCKICCCDCTYMCCIYFLVLIVFLFIIAKIAIN